MDGNHSYLGKGGVIGAVFFHLNEAFDIVTHEGFYRENKTMYKTV